MVKYDPNWDWISIYDGRTGTPFTRDHDLYRVVHAALERYPRKTWLIPTPTVEVDLSKQRRDRDGNVIPATVKLAVPNRVWSNMFHGNPEQNNLYCLLEIEREAVRALNSGLIIPG